MVEGRLSARDSARDNQLRNAIFGQELPVIGPCGEKFLDAAIGEGALDGKGLRQLHLDVVAIGDVEAAMRRLLALGAGMTEGQHLAAGIGGLEEPRHNGLDQRLGQIIERGPEQNHIELALGEAERLIEKAFDIPDCAAVLFGLTLPLAGGGVGDKIGKKDAVAEAREVMNIGRRGIAHVDGVETGLSFKPLAQGRPCARVARHSFAGQAWGGSRRGRRRDSGIGWFTLGFPVKPTAKHVAIPLLAGFLKPPRRRLLNRAAILWRLATIASLGGGLCQIHIAAKDGIVFDGQAEGVDVAFHHAAGAQLDAARSHQVALDLAQNQNLFGGEVGGNICAGADGQPALREEDGTLHPPIHNEVFTALDFAANHHCFADARWNIFHCHNLLPSGTAQNCSWPEILSIRRSTTTQGRLLQSTRIRPLKLALHELYPTWRQSINRSAARGTIGSKMRDAIQRPPMPVRLKGMRSHLALFLLILLTGAAHGQAALTPAQAQALVGRALATESRAARELSRTSHPMRYRLRKSSPRLTSTKEIAETADGDVARLIDIGDRPLSPEEEQREQARLDELLSDPSLQQHRKLREDSDTERALKVLRVLPTAFLYQFAGTGAAASGMVVKFTFKPNPQFDPPDLETQVLTAMAGELWIDPVQERVVRLAGSLQQDKDFGWGILGQLDKGGWVEIEQADVGEHQWRIVHLKLVMNGRVLFKTRNSDSVQDYSHFAPLPVGMSYRQAIQMLRGGR